MHQYINEMKEHEFVLWVIGANAKDKGKFVYELPKNVVEVHEVFLDDALRLKDSGKMFHAFTEEETNSLKELMLCRRPNWEILFRLYHDQKLNPMSFLRSEEFLNILTECCIKDYPYTPFADAFHTMRSMLLPVLYLMGSEVPKADVYHAICTGYGGLLACLGGHVYKKKVLLTEHGIYGERNFTTVKHVPLENATVVFQGVEGAYSYAAMRQYFGKNIESYHVKTWRTAMEDVTHGKADYAVLPIENSTAGIVADIYDLLMEYKLYIVGEQIIRVDHVLLGMPDAQIKDIREVCSHPQGLAQCKAFLEENPSWKKKEVENTAGAAKKVSEVGDKGVAAIASREAGEVFGLKVLAENICREKANSTRFIIVSRKPEYEEKAGKISICFELPHESGTLYNMLSHIIYNGLNMTKIESRPIPGKSWEYRFFVDFTGKLGESAVENALRGIEAEANVLRVLGNY